jgi:hypothetical protein
LEKAARIKQQLGGSGDYAEAIPERPKGMHQRTYERLRNEGEEAQLPYQDRIMKRLHGFLVGAFRFGLSSSGLSRARCTPFMTCSSSGRSVVRADRARSGPLANRIVSIGRCDDGCDSSTNAVTRRTREGRPSWRRRWESDGRAALVAVRCRAGSRCGRFVRGAKKGLLRGWAAGVVPDRVVLQPLDLMDGALLTGEARGEVTGSSPVTVATTT